MARARSTPARRKPRAKPESQVVQELRAQVTDLKAQVNDFSGRADRLSKDLKTAQVAAEKAGELEARNAELTKTIGDLTRQLHESEHRVSDLEAEAERNAPRLAALDTIRSAVK